MIYFFTPYSFDFKLLDAISGCMDLLQPDDWAVIMDGDTMFLQPDFGHQIQRHIEAHPEAGLFTCFASRCHYSIQRIIGVDPFNDSILYHKDVANDKMSAFAGDSVESIAKLRAPMVIRKSTWDRVLPNLQKKTSGKLILGVDTKISKAILEIGLDHNFVS
ncbi:MAG: hypothetical protein D4R64_05580 [Porphyromonadaceae bacterium]|nr:MAG: hypothetical protein D4R64_05580 [Porphyromonadaceae bacterium]